MLQCRPSTLLPAVAEAERADLLTETGDYLRFRHDLLRQAVRDDASYIAAGDPA